MKFKKLFLSFLFLLIVLLVSEFGLRLNSYFNENKSNPLKVAVNSEFVNILVIGDSTSLDYPELLDSYLKIINPKAQVINGSLPVVCAENFKKHQQMCSKGNYDFYDSIIKEVSPQIILFMAGERIKITMKNFEDLNHSKISFLNKFFIGKILYRFVVETIDPLWDKAQYAFFTLIKGEKKVIEESLNKNDDVEEYYKKLNYFIHGEYILSRSDIEGMFESLSDIDKNVDRKKYAIVKVILKILLNKYNSQEEFQNEMRESRISSEEQQHLNFHFFKAKANSQLLKKLISNNPISDLMAIDFSREYGIISGDLQLKILLDYSMNNIISFSSLELAKIYWSSQRYQKAFALYEKIIENYQKNMSNEKKFIVAKASFSLLSLNSSMDVNRKYELFKFSMKLDQSDNYVFNKFVEFILQNKQFSKDSINFLQKLSNDSKYFERIKEISELIVDSTKGMYGKFGAKSDFILALSSKDYSKANDAFMEIEFDKSDSLLDVKSIENFNRIVLNNKNIPSSVFVIQNPNQSIDNVRGILSQNNYRYIDSYKCIKDEISNKKLRVENVFEPDGIHLQKTGSKVVAKCIAKEISKVIP